MVLVGLELIYLIAANIVLQTGLVRKAAESAQGLKIAYGTAYSLLPGRMSVRELLLRFEDYNVQFQLTISRAEFDLSLHELVLRKFHVLGLRAKDVVFLFRHKVQSIENNEPRLAAFPRIEGYEDPPLYRGKPPPAVSDEAARELWEIHVEDIVAIATELWLLEHRFRGRAEARGAFLLRPARWVEVTPGTIQLASGSLTAGVHRVAESVKGSVSCSVPGFDVRSAPGMQVFRHLSARADLQLSGGALDFVNLYTEPQFGLSLTGSQRSEAHVRLEGGVLMPETLVRMHADAGRISFGPVELAGQLSATLERDTKKAGVNLRVEALHSTLETRAPRSTAQAPVVQQLSADLATSEANVAGSMTLADASMTSRVTVPDFAWIHGLFSTDLGPRLVGSGDLSLAFNRDLQRTGDGRFSLDVRNAGIVTKTGQVRLSGNGTAKFRTAEEPRPYAQGALSVRLSGADSLLSLAIGPTLRSVANGVLDLDVLEATVAFHVSRSLTKLELTRARSGNLDARGQLRSSQFKSPRGALLLSSGALRVGVTLEQGEAGLSPLVGADWLEHALRSMAPSQPEGG
jgi:hypothetical protein